MGRVCCNNLPVITRPFSITTITLRLPLCLCVCEREWILERKSAVEKQKAMKTSSSFIPTSYLQQYIVSFLYLVNSSAEREKKRATTKTKNGRKAEEPRSMRDRTRDRKKKAASKTHLIMMMTMMKPEERYFS